MNIFDRLLKPTFACDNCGKRSRINLEDRVEPEGTILRFFLCVRCGQEYQAARYTPRGVELMNEIQNLEVRPANAKRLKKLQRLLKAEVSRP